MGEDLDTSLAYCFLDAVARSPVETLGKEGIESAAVIWSADLEAPLVYRQAHIALAAWRLAGLQCNGIDGADGHRPDRVEADQELHTSFKLRREGEFLALVEPDATTVVSAFGAQDSDYVEQQTDVSYGWTSLPSDDEVNPLFIDHKLA